MNTRRSNLLYALSVSVLALGLVAPAGADEAGASTAGFEFDLDASLLGEAFVLAPADGLTATNAADRSQLFQIAEAGNLAAQDLSAARVSAQTTASSSGSSGKGGFGRWLKRHWWAPTLVGVALGVVLLEPFDDDKVDDRQ